MAQHRPVSRDGEVRLGVAHFRLLLTYLEELGADPDACLAATGISPERVNDPDSEIGASQEVALIRWLIRRHGDPFSHGLQLGLRQGLTAHGPWGMGLLSSSGVAAGAEWAGRFAVIAFPFTRYVWARGKNGPVLVLIYDHMPEDIRSFLLARDLASIRAIHDDLLPDQPVGIDEVRLAEDAGEKAEKGVEALRRLFSCPVLTGQPFNALAVNPQLLRASFSRGNELTLLQCERYCSELVNRRQSEETLAGQVRRLLEQYQCGSPGLARVAAHFHRSERNLRLRLSREGTSWSQLRDQVLAGRAQQLLGQGRLTIEQIADRLGYTDRSSFSHAFKRWTGMSPAQFRRAQGHGVRKPAIPD